METVTKLPEHIGRRFHLPWGQGDLMEIIDAERYTHSDTHSVYRTEEVAVAQRVGNTDPDDLVCLSLADTYEE